MRKLLFLSALALVSCLAVNAQERFVSETPTNKNVILEEYTGINCGYCPDGHRIANELAANNPGRVFPINIHAGGYAANTYTTQFGNALVNQTGLEGYPSGTVNRHVFSGSVTALGRGSWQSAVNIIKAQTSPVNVAARGTLDWTTRELTLTVQYYYTSSSAQSTNMLNVAIVQDNVLGSQSGASLNPAQVVGSQYRHMHMLRHLITGQWGQEISTTTEGTFGEEVITYTIPASLGSPAIAAPIEDLRFIVFIAEGHQEIYTGVEAEITGINMPAINPRLDGVAQATSTDCTNEAAVVAKVKNVGSETLTSMTFNCTVAGTAQPAYTWTGSIASMQTAEIELPAFAVTLNANQSVSVSIANANGTDVDVAARNCTVKKSVGAGVRPMTFQLYTDQYASETTFKFFDANNNVVLEGGPWTNVSQPTTTLREFTFAPETSGCYRLEVYDSYGDGIHSSYGNGYFQIVDANGDRIVYNNGQYGAQATHFIDAHGVGIEDHTTDNFISVYPNPATSELHIYSSCAIQQTEVYNLQGQRVMALTGDVRDLSIGSLANGMYTVKITTAEGVSIQKIVKK